MGASQYTVSAAEMEAEWLEIKTAQQNPARFRPLYERYYETIFRFVHKRTEDMDLSADITAQVFLKALQRLERYQFKGVPFSAWLFRIASNEVAQHFRNVQQNRVVCVDDYSFSNLAEEMEVEDNTWQIEEMLQALSQLKPDEILLIEMRFFEQRPFKEIADILELTESNTKVKTYRILERVRKLMESQKTK
ncbi:MAG: sigma-70 family RNA polymerase sigma factor [Saprospiraceae bacterium]